MKVIIIAQHGCPNCMMAVESYRERGIEPEIHDGFTAIADADLRDDLMAELMVKRPSGDPMRAPIIFEDGKLTEWNA